MSMHRRLVRLFPAMVVGLLLAAGPAAAQWGVPDAYSGRDQVLRCESNDGRIRHCDADTRSGVRLLRQLSKADCREGQTWGVDRGGVWVREGCRAEFALGYGGSDVGSGYGAQVFRCESHDGRRKDCRADTRGGVELVRQLSKASCIRGQEWDVTRDGVWVSRGCRAEFRTLAGGYPGNAGDRVQMLRCESNDGRIRHCPVSTRGGVQLARQLSAAPCREGQSWGRDRNSIWVSRGCRADFEVGGRGNGWGWGRDDDGDRHGHGQGRLLRCESNDGRVQHCTAAGSRGAELVRQLSRAACVQGRSWGWDRGGVWVSEGCRGEFRTW